MTKSHLLATLLALQGVAGICEAQQQRQQQQDPAAGTGKPATTRYRDRISEVDLLKLRAQARPMAGSAPGQAASAPAARTFAETSDFIAFNGQCTFVPKGAVLHVPDRMRQNIVPGMSGQVVFWTDFLNRFPAIVEPLEVTLQEASGAKPIEPKRLAAALRSERLIITVIRGNPTSVCKSADASTTTSR